MFSRRNRRPKSAELLRAWESLDAGDIPGALRQVRQGGEDLPAAEVALVVGRAAEAAGFDDLREAAAALAADPGKAQALFRFGYACIERGLNQTAIPPLREALRLSPGSLVVVRELVAAYEHEGRHREAVGVLSGYEKSFADWPDRYLLVHNALMSGDLDLARRQHALLPDPRDPMWLPARARQNMMLERAANAAGATPLDGTDLRGWQFVIGGTLLATLSPYGFSAGMTGRYAFLQDSYGQCLLGLRRLKSALAAAEVTPRSVSLLPGRGSHVLGLAAAEVLGVPSRPFAPGEPDTVVIAYDLDEVAGEAGGPEILGDLVERTPGQVLHEHASCWTDAPGVTADSVTLLHQSVVAPWAGQLRAGADGQVERGPSDDRPAERIAAEVVAAAPAADPGDGDGPADPDEVLEAFAASVRDTWLRGDRRRLGSSGPVRSSRFA
ncbi:hypothetical protein OG233_26345 [Streptomyces sp. NBC_01218]|uniref:hypothetical protein n=1 Tax=Streptomyces sp. NBC_01218 TaxID=2903780 RepID=UPI002E0FB480|nr:hypothetical protein OG233_26345 [Streptomyces sp. NBC_01218]